MSPMSPIPGACRRSGIVFRRSPRVPFPVPMTEAVAKMVGRFERMERSDQYAFHQHISGHFKTVVGFPCYTTSNFEAMKRFLEDIGMEVRESRSDQRCPMFNSGRGAFVKRGDVSFNLEESADDQASTPFNLCLFGYSPGEFERLGHLGYDRKTESSIFGTSHLFTSPDGGRVLIG